MNVVNIMKTKLSVLLLGALLVCFSCSEEKLRSLPSDANEADSALTIEEAKAIFGSQMSEISVSRSEELTPGDFTPLWDKSVSSRDGNISGIDIPILPQYKYRVMRSSMSNGAVRAYTVDVTQKMTVLKNTETDKTGLFLMSLIPDKSYYERNRGNLSSHFVSRGEKNGYSGIVIYSLLRTNQPVRIERYVVGEKAFEMTIPAETVEETQINRKAFNGLMKGMKFAISQSVRSRFGESDDYWDWTDDGYNNYNDWFGPSELPVDEDFDDLWEKTLEEIDDPSYGYEGGEPDFEFGPWIQIYHRTCGKLLGVEHWNDWDGGELYCSSCRKYVTDFKYTYSYY